MQYKYRREVRGITAPQWLPHERGLGWNLAAHLIPYHSAARTRKGACALVDVGLRRVRTPARRSELMHQLDRRPRRLRFFLSDLTPPPLPPPDDYIPLPTPLSPPVY